MLYIVLVCYQPRPREVSKIRLPNVAKKCAGDEVDMLALF